MADVKKIATRESYGNALAELGDKYENLYVLDADLAAATKTGIFKKKFPDRFFDCGIAEANMMGVAAGMAAAGKIPFASTFAMFAAGRAFEIVRNSIGYPHLNVKIGATHAGISVGEDGATHQCNEDIALMRTIPGMTVINPADDVEARAAVEAAIQHNGPVYLRFGRLAAPVFNDPAAYKFELGKGIKLREGKDISIIATGLMVSEALAAAEMLAAQGVDAEIINIHTIKPIDADLIAEYGATKNIPNKATVTIDGKGQVTNEVLVTPPDEPGDKPEKKINGIKDADTLYQLKGMAAKKGGAELYKYINCEQFRPVDLDQRLADAKQRIEGARDPNGKDYPDKEQLRGDYAIIATVNLLKKAGNIDLKTIIGKEFDDAVEKVQQGKGFQDMMELRSNETLYTNAITGNGRALLLDMPAASQERKRMNANRQELDKDPLGPEMQGAKKK